MDQNWLTMLSFVSVAMIEIAGDATPPPPPLTPPAIGLAQSMDAMLAGVPPLSPDDLSRRIAAAKAQPLGSIGNPVRAEMPEGELAYIQRLRCTDGTPPKVGARRNIGVGIYGSILDVYPLDCGAVLPGKVDVHMDMYHRGHIEKDAAAGFRIGT